MFFHFKTEDFLIAMLLMHFLRTAFQVINEYLFDQGIFDKYMFMNEEW